jgi:hypothetical protein
LAHLTKSEAIVAARHESQGWCILHTGALDFFEWRERNGEIEIRECEVKAGNSPLTPEQKIRLEILKRAGRNAFVERTNVPATTEKEKTICEASLPKVVDDYQYTLDGAKIVHVFKKGVHKIRLTWPCRFCGSYNRTHEERSAGFFDGTSTETACSVCERKMWEVICNARPSLMEHTRVEFVSEGCKIFLKHEDTYVEPPYTTVKYKRTVWDVTEDLNRFKVQSRAY